MEDDKEAEDMEEGFSSADLALEQALVEVEEGGSMPCKRMVA